LRCDHFQMAGRKAQ